MGYFQRSNFARVTVPRSQRWLRCASLPELYRLLTQQVSILPVNGNKRAWFGFSACSHCEATAITIAHEHEAFPCSAAADDLDFSSSDEFAADLRREGGRTVRKIGARLCREGIPE